MSDSVDLLKQIVTTVQKKNDKEQVNDTIRTKPAKVIGVDDETHKVFVYFLEDTEQKEYTFYNKSGEILSEGDTVKVFYTTNVAKGWIGARMGEPNINRQSYIPYISAKVQNHSAITYDKIERGVLSIDFQVDGTDSDVVFVANQMCNVSADGELKTYYKVDGTTQDYKPIETLNIGKRMISHIFPMTLSNGKHNFAVFVSSQEGKGDIKIGDLIGTLSGQISGLRDVVPPNENLILCLKGVPANTTITFPPIYSKNDNVKIVDWGDGSEIEECLDGDSIQHTYENYGDYIVTLKSNTNKFISSTAESSYKPYLSSVCYPDSASMISSSLWMNCPSLETIILGKSLTTVSLTLTDDVKLTSLLFPDTLTTISVNISNTNISSIVIPPKVTKVGDFSSVSSLTSIEFQNAILGNCRGAENLTKLVMSNSITEVPDLYFNRCSKLNNIKWSQNITSLGKNSFSFSAITSVPVLPKLTDIKDAAFNNCTQLSSVQLGDKVVSIGKSAFARCSVLTKINLPKSLTKIDVQAFYNTPVALTKKDFLPSLTSIGNEAFMNSGVLSTKLYANCSYGTSVFKNCTSLEELEIENGVISISDNCFYGCTSLDNVVIPPSVKTIGTSAFYKSGVSSLTLSEGIETINNSAFYGCTRLQNVVIPSTVTVLGQQIFQGCTSLSSAEFVDGVTLISSNMFRSCTNLYSVDVGTVTRIDGGAFSGCTNLTEVNLNPDTVIGGGAFSNTNIAGISLNRIAKLPDGATTTYGGIYNIGRSAFSGSSIMIVDDMTYKFNVGLKKTEYFRLNTSESWGDPVITDFGLMADGRGVYDAMGATEDSVFAETQLKSVSDYLKEHSEYANISTDTYRCTYTAYRYTG